MPSRSRSRSSNKLGRVKVECLDDGYGVVTPQRVPAPSGPSSSQLADAVMESSEPPLGPAPSDAGTPELASDVTQADAEALRQQRRLEEERIMDAFDEHMRLDDISPPPPSVGLSAAGGDEAMPPAATDVG